MGDSEKSGQAVRSSKPCYLGTVGRSGQVWNGVEKTQGIELLI